MCMLNSFPRYGCLCWKAGTTPSLCCYAISCKWLKTLEKMQYKLMFMMAVDMIVNSVRKTRMSLYCGAKIKHYVRSFVDAASTLHLV